MRHMLVLAILLSHLPLAKTQRYRFVPDDPPDPNQLKESRSTDMVSRCSAAVSGSWPATFPDQTAWNTFLQDSVARNINGVSMHKHQKAWRIGAFYNSNGTTYYQWGSFSPTHANQVFMGSTDSNNPPSMQSFSPFTTQLLWKSGEPTASTNEPGLGIQYMDGQPYGQSSSYKLTDIPDPYHTVGFICETAVTPAPPTPIPPTPSPPTPIPPTPSPTRLCTESMDCSGHASNVTGTTGLGGCRCTCNVGYSGDACDECSSNYTGYPTCVKLCTNSLNCNSNAVSADGTVGNCSCSCKPNYDGSSCNSCASGYTQYPDCYQLCTNATDCNNNAASVSGNVGTGCSCECKTGFSGSVCTSCADDYEDFPNCYRSCSVSRDCSSGAMNVTGNANSGCSCECRTGFSGSKCDICASGFTSPPNCYRMCTNGTDCHSNALNVSGHLGIGCDCSCIKGFGGDNCSTCALGFEDYPTCRRIPNNPPPPVLPPAEYRPLFKRYRGYKNSAVSRIFSDFDSAKLFCQRQGGWLATIYSQEDQMRLYTDVYISSESDRPLSSEEEEELFLTSGKFEVGTENGTWQWEDGPTGASGGTHKITFPDPYTCVQYCNWWGHYPIKSPKSNVDTFLALDSTGGWRQQDFSASSAGVVCEFATPSLSLTHTTMSLPDTSSTIPRDTMSLGISSKTLQKDTTRTLFHPSASASIVTPSLQESLSKSLTTAPTKTLFGSSKTISSSRSVHSATLRFVLNAQQLPSDTADDDDVGIKASTIPLDDILELTAVSERYLNIYLRLQGTVWDLSSKRQQQLQERSFAQQELPRQTVRCISFQVNDHTKQGNIRNTTSNSDTDLHVGVGRLTPVEKEAMTQYLFAEEGTVANFTEELVAPEVLKLSFKTVTHSSPLYSTLRNLQADVHVSLLTDVTCIGNRVSPSAAFFTFKRPTPIATRKENPNKGEIATAEDTATVVQLAAAAGGVPLVATQMARSQIILSLRLCSPDFDQTLGIIQNPTQLDLIDPQIGQYVAATIFNPLIIIVFFGLHVLLAKVYAIKNQVDLHEGLRYVRCPSLSVLPLYYLTEPTASASVVVMIYADRPEVKAVAALSGLSILVMLFGFFVYLRKTWGGIMIPGQKPHHLRRKNKLKSSYANRGTASESDTRYAFRKLCVWGSFFIDGGVHWRDQDGKAGYCRANRLCFMDFTGAYYWFMAVELGFAGIIGFLDGVKLGHDQCGSIIITLVALLFAFLITIIILKPYNAPFLLLFSIIVTAVQFIAALCMAIAMWLSNGEQFVDYAEILAMWSMYFIIFQAIFGILPKVKATGEMIWRNCRSNLAQTEPTQISAEELAGRLLETAQRVDSETLVVVAPQDHDAGASREVDVPSVNEELPEHEILIERNDDDLTGDCDDRFNENQDEKIDTLPRAQSQVHVGLGRIEQEKRHQQEKDTWAAILGGERDKKRSLSSSSTHNENLIAQFLGVHHRNEEGSYFLAKNSSSLVTPREVAEKTSEEEEGDHHRTTTSTSVDPDLEMLLGGLENSSDPPPPSAALDIL